MVIQKTIYNESAAQVVRVQIAGTYYLGTFDGRAFNGTKSQHFANYIEERELGQLKTLIVGDLNTLVLEPLTEEEQLDLDRLESLWKLAEKKSKTWVTSQVFKGLTGK